MSCIYEKKRSTFTKWIFFNGNGISEAFKAPKVLKLYRIAASS